MSKETVILTIRGDSFEVPRKMLAAFIQGSNCIARSEGKRPGEPIEIEPFNGRSADLCGAVLTVLTSPIKKINR